jgi:hypothetical protein
MSHVWEVPMMQGSDESGTALLQGEPAWTKPRSDGVTGGSCFDLVMCSFGPSMPGCTTLGDAVPALGFSCVVDVGVARLGLPGSPDSLFLLSSGIKWRAAWSMHVHGLKL